MCFLCFFICIHDHKSKHLELYVRFPIVQAMFCLDADIDLGLCFPRKREEAYNVRPLVSRGIC